MKPQWLEIKPVSTQKYNEVKQTVKSLNLHTVCTEANCPNITECWSGGTATFMVLGELCTRGCRFCNVLKSASGANVDPLEPYKLGQAISKWGLKYVVITSVCRDDLPDQGAGHFARCIEEVKRQNPSTLVEVLIPDFQGNMEYLRKVVEAKPDVVGHNIETVERLTPNVRDKRAKYGQSLGVLRQVKEIDPTRYTKSAMMLGIGETEPEIQKAFDDLRDANVDFLAVGQYLKPKGYHLEVKEYITPQKFESLRQDALNRGFLYVASGPFVRSSYRAGEHFIAAMVGKK